MNLIDDFVRPQQIEEIISFLGEYVVAYSYPPAFGSI